MKTKYLFFDLDGTISFDGDTVSEKSLEYIKKVQALGHKVFINTGRGLSHISKKIIDALNWDGIIAGGGYMQYNGEIVHNKTLTADSIKKLYRYSIEKNAVAIFEGVYTIYTSLPYPVTQVLITNENIEKTENVTCVTVLCPIEKEEAKALFPDVDTVIMPNYFEGYPKDHGKDTCMKILTEKFGIAPEDMIAFGDSENDESMLRYAGVSVVMSTAPKRFDSFVTMRTSSDSEGAAEAIAKIFDL